MERRKIDSKYVIQLQEGDTSVFEYIFDFYRNSIYYFAITYVRNKADAEEVVQNTFIIVFKQINSLRNPDSFHSWIHKIAFRSAMRVIEKNKSRNIVALEEDFGLENIEEKQASPSEILDRNEISTVVGKEMENLSPKLLAVAQLKYFDDLTVYEIADILDIPVGTVKSRLMKVREKLQPILDDGGYSPSKYLSVTMVPIVFEAFKQLIDQQTMSPKSVEMIEKSILATGAAGTGAVNIAMILKACGILTVGSVGVFTVYTQVNTVEPVIESVAYYQGVTNKDVDVELLLNEKISENDISIKSKNKDVEFSLDNNKLVFVVRQNGDYTVEIKDEQEIISVSNIDKNNPVLTEVNYEENKLSYKFKENESGLDLSNSYFEDKNGNRYKLSEQNYIEGEFSGTVIAYLQDYAGNFGKYEFDI